MDESNINWIFAVASLCAGIGIGALGYHLLNATAAHQQKLRQRLAERDRELVALKEGIGDHFDDVTELVESLKRDSDTLSQRLAEHATTLKRSTTAQKTLEFMPAHEPPPAEDVAQADAEMPTPRDYADGSGGTLSESFGLKRDADKGETSPPRY
ncbi:YhcB family protein [Halomonas urumqiensis]|uniref:YhcB family protein n=1 Tax=Halomonas urumqiensis TaxID=1684789 RepID=UPI0015E0E15D|nr:DUF1043 family protein [Halomonas urumqiensis]GHE22517.1 hypothetical protein GCM10017767_30380 [Halomonas urumqiensis]